MPSTKPLGSKGVADGGSAHGARARSAGCSRTGQRSKEISVRLGISERTVKAYLSSVYDKLGVDSRGGNCGGGGVGIVVKKVWKFLTRLPIATLAR